MKISLLYGFLMALGSILLTLALYFFDFHSNVEKLPAAQVIGAVVGLAVTSTCLYFGLKEGRARTTAAQNDWGLGSALGQGLGITLFSLVLSAGFSYFYFASINSDFGSLVQRTQLATLEEKGMPPEQIDRAAQMGQRFFSPAALTIAGSIVGFLTSTLIVFHLALGMIRRHPRATLLRYYTIIGAPVGLLVGFFQGLSHGNALIGAGIGLVAGPLLELVVALIVLSLAKYEPLPATDHDS